MLSRFEEILGKNVKYVHLQPLGNYSMINNELYENLSISKLTDIGQVLVVPMSEFDCLQQENFM